MDFGNETKKYSNNKKIQMKQNNNLNDHITTYKKLINDLVKENKRSK